MGDVIGGCSKQPAVAAIAAGAVRFSFVSDELWVLGDLAWDVLVRSDTELLPGGDTFGDILLLPGGSAANVAVWCARCGRNTHFVGKVGQDRFGQMGRENLTAEGVVAHLAVSDTRPTGSIAVFVDHRGERSMVSARGADFDLVPDEIPHGEMSKISHLHLTGWSFFSDPPRSAAMAAAETAKGIGATVSFDPSAFQMIDELGVDRFLSIVSDLGPDLLLPNKEEARSMTGRSEPQAMAKRLAELFPETLIVLKLDADGALVLDRDGTTTAIAPTPADPIDSTGAGDSFAGGFLAHYLEHGDVVAAGRLATAVSAWTIGRQGARPDADDQLTALLDSLV